MTKAEQIQALRELAAWCVKYDATIEHDHYFDILIHFNRPNGMPHATFEVPYVDEDFLQPHLDKLEAEQ